MDYLSSNTVKRPGLQLVPRSHPRSPAIRFLEASASFLQSANLDILESHQIAVILQGDAASSFPAVVA